MLLGFALLLTVVEIPLLRKQTECMQILNQPSERNYPIWDIPEDESPEEAENRVKQINAAFTEDAILFLLCFFLCPCGIALCIVSGIFSLKSLIRTHKKKKVIPAVFLFVSALLLAGNLFVLIRQFRI